MNKLRDSVPYEMKSNTAEIMAEIWNQYAYLVKNYRDGELSLVSYCFKYAYKRTLNAIWKEHNRNKNTVSLETLNKELATMKTPITEIQHEEHEIQLSCRIKSLLSLMPPRDFAIAKEYMAGLTFEKIAEIHHLTEGAVRKILRKYAI